MASERKRRVCIAGASGRMGQMLIAAVRASDDCVLGGALDIASSPAIGQDASGVRYEACFNRPVSPANGQAGA